LISSSAMASRITAGAGDKTRVLGAG